MYNREEKLAIKESLILWKFLAQSGHDNRESAVDYLYNQGRLSKSSYFCDCPLCEGFGCLKCPWRTVPNNIGLCISCTSPGSPFRMWRCPSDQKAKQQAASAVYKFLKQIDMEE